MPSILSVTTATGPTPADGYPDQSPTGSGINSPELNPKTGKPKQRAISDVSHIFRIIGDLQNARRQQNEKNGRIQEKLNSERPYKDDVLKQEGLGYKSNFTTKPLSTTVGKVSSRLTKSIQAARYLTAAELPDSFPDAKKKTELFRAEVTSTIRRWPGWYNFVNSVFHEDAVFGWAVAAWLDEYAWKPKFFRQDQAFLPDGTKQTVDGAQFAAFLDRLMPHELATFIADREAAEAAGWNIANTVESINNARPPGIPSSQAAPYTDFRRYEDAIRESSVSLTLTSGAKQIDLWHVFAVEIDGKVSHYIGDGNSKKLLFEKEDRFANVEDCLAFLSYEQAATLMGSKGIGREVYELAGALDRARNEAVDRLQMSGKMIVSGPENRINRFKLHVIGNVVIVPEGFKLEQNKILPATTEFIALEQQLVGLLDQIAGGVTPRTFERERVTKAEVDLYASREEEKRDDITTRAVTQFGAIVSTIQRRLASPDAVDQDAKDMQERLLRYMDRAELDFLSRQPALKTIEDYTMADAQKLILFAQEKRQDPLYDHRKLERKAAAALINAEFADDVILPENDPTVTAEQSRTQLFENELLKLGRPVPVSPRDAHDVHIEVLKADLQGIAQQAGAAPDPSNVSVLTNFVQHWSEHLNGLAQTGIDRTVLAQMEAELKAVAKQVGELQAVAAQQIAAAQPGGQPAPAGAAPAAPAEAAPADETAAPSPAV